MNGRCVKCGDGWFYSRRLCRPCYDTARRQGDVTDFETVKRPWLDVIEDAEILLARTAPELVADALGMRPGSIARAASRHGRPDLARPFWAAQNRAERAARRTT